MFRDSGAASRGNKRVPPRKKENAEKTGRGQKKLRFAPALRLGRAAALTVHRAVIHFKLVRRLNPLLHRFRRTGRSGRGSSELQERDCFFPPAQPRISAQDAIEPVERGVVRRGEQEAPPLVPRDRAAARRTRSPFASSPAAAGETSAKKKVSQWNAVLRPALHPQNSARGEVPFATRERRRAEKEKASTKSGNEKTDRTRGESAETAFTPTPPSRRSGRGSSEFRGRDCFFPPAQPRISAQDAIEPVIKRGGWEVA